MAVIDKLRQFGSLALGQLRQGRPLTRVDIEARESVLLSDHARLSSASQGRIRSEQPCEFRPAFARDRDRIFYSKYFSYLQGKTQVFSPESLSFPDKQEVHNRIMHTVKVAQIARDICRALGLNEDLAEAIALGHDLGHPPFGHEGEKILSEFSRQYLKEPFKHNRQSLRIVRDLERLNLSYEVMDGILCHDGEKKDRVFKPRPKDPYSFNFDDSGFPATLEGCVVRLADRIAYLPMDLYDGLMLKLVKDEHIPPLVLNDLGITPGEIIDTLIRDVIKESAGKNLITMSPRVWNALDELFDFNYENIYFSQLNMDFKRTIFACVNVLLGHFMEKNGQDARAAIDNVVALTDQQALSIYQKIRS